MDKCFDNPFGFKLIYIFEIPDEQHKGILKIGDATIYTSASIADLHSNCSELNKAAKKRIDSYTKTANIKYNLLHTELAVYIESRNGERIIKSFRDYDVHNVLTNSGIKKFKSKDTSGAEWFEVDLDTAKKAIAAVKDMQPNLGNLQTGKVHIPIVFRPEQELAIQKTKKQFKQGNRMLWNAKMRFGKTLTALQVVKECGFSKTIIVTHRPVVDHGWYEDFGKIFNSSDDYEYGSKNNGRTIDYLLKGEKKFVYFASMQDLRGSTRVGGQHNKNNEIFDLKWDLVIVDEAHEGTTTALGDEVIRNLVKEGGDNDTKLLALSGTPFNILNSYNDESIYTWDYVMEQDSKHKWYIEHFGDSNPYDDLPELKIYTYDIGNMIGHRYIEIEDKAFNFREFFRTWTGYSKFDHAALPADKSIGDFVHEKDVQSFLNLITKEENSNYPYSNEEFRKLFQHSLWIVPGVREAKALKALMMRHPIFGNGTFNIVNVAGEGDEEKRYDDALLEVQNAIKESEKDFSSTITISCGKLTTGVSVPEWTAVFMLAGSYSTSASSYMQTIFRVQTPCKKNGMTKQCAYVFDFAPDRTLKMVASAVALSTRAGKTHSSDRVALGAFLNYCPVISISGTSMKQYDTNVLLQQLKRAYAERAVENGFDDVYLYNDELLHLDEKEIAEFQSLKGIIGTTKAAHKTNEIKVNDQGFTQEEYEEIERIEKKKKSERTPEEIEQLEKLKEQKKQRNNAISILRGISIRIPLLIYGADISIDEDITMEKLIDIVDDASWKEFMPQGVTKEIFKGFIKYYDPEVFVSAGRKIRNTVLSADELPIKDRIIKISNLMMHFKNPDKETVLTPWRVVNMHMSDMLGGYDFFDESHDYVIDEPRFIDKGEITRKVLMNDDAKVLEINSKTGLYPLYITYSLFRYISDKRDDNDLTIDSQNEIWSSVVQNNLFIVCKTRMAKYITRRTLLGYRDGTINAHYFDDLINMLDNKKDLFISKVSNPNYWKKEGKRMEFDAIVGNPPYQENIGTSQGNASLAKQLFPSFVETSIRMGAKYVSLVTPSRWFTANAQDGSFPKLREFVMKHNSFRSIVHYNDNTLLFSNVTIGPVNYFLWEKDYNGNVEFTEVLDDASRTVTNRPLFEDGLSIIISNSRLIPYIKKVKNRPDFVPLSELSTGRNPFGIVGKGVERITKDSPFEGSVKVQCAYEICRYIKREAVTKNEDIMDSWKIFTSKANGGAGMLSDDGPVAIIGRSYLSGPGCACTDSLIPFGKFKTKSEAMNLKKYMETKFARFYVGILKSSQNLYQIVYACVPAQDFTSKSDIDWSASIDNIDQQLYAKYKLTKKEIDYIESKIKTLD